jgi:methyltransferase family protein/C-methyltransferase-like protein
MPLQKTPLMRQCPICSSTEIADTVRRERLPVMQNALYRTLETAKAAPQGRLSLAVCRSCGFAWNRAFDPGALVYDDNYDNAVPSLVMDAYYREIAAFLSGKYQLEGGIVVDVGCGSGRFLKVICEVVPGCRGLGVDPALERDHEELGGRIRLIKSMFTSEVIKERPSLIVCRHVLEHIPQPVQFFEAIRLAVADFGPCPCFFEVPDLGWILDNEAFWDFCYEHCNYFGTNTLGEAARRAGFAPTNSRVAFGSQYCWLEALSEQEHVPSRTPAKDGLYDHLLAYSLAESEKIASMRLRLKTWKRDGFTVAVWGMATKGVLFSYLLDPDRSLIDFCVDINPNKQGCYVPVTGHAISPPSVLREAVGERVVVMVMNENYGEEIRGICREVGIEPICVSASGASL